jgi:serine/threonine-protein kinase RsbW
MKSGSRIAMSRNGTAAMAETRTHSGPADAETVTAFRDLVRDWLNSTVQLDDERITDIVLATDEALANCAEHAYRGQQTTGVMTLNMSCARPESAVKVLITDHGRWIEPDTAANNLRGRGLILMRALADDCTVQVDRYGTSVCLHFHDCPAFGAP